MMTASASRSRRQQDRARDAAGGSVPFSAACRMPDILPSPPNRPPRAARVAPFIFALIAAACRMARRRDRSPSPVHDSGALALLAVVAHARSRRRSLPAPRSGGLLRRGRQRGAALAAPADRAAVAAAPAAPGVAALDRPAGVFWSGSPSAACMAGRPSGRRPRADRAPAACRRRRWRSLIGRAVVLAGVTVGAGGRRAALPGHHAEPAEGRRPADREQPSPARLPRLLRVATCRRTSASADATARSTRSTRPVCRRSSRRRSPSAATAASSCSCCCCRRPGQRPGVASGWLVTGRTDAAWFGWAAVDPLGDVRSSTAHGLSRRPGSVAVADRRLGAVPRRARSRATRASRSRRGSGTALRWRRCRGCTRASRCWPAALGALVLLRMARDAERADQGAARFSRSRPSASSAGSAYFIAIYGTPDPSAPYGGEARIVRLRARRSGRPAVRSALRAARLRAGAAVRVRRHRRHARAPRHGAATRSSCCSSLVPYLVVVTYVAMWWGGRSAPARFFVPVLPWMAIPAAAAWTAMTPRGTAARWRCGALVFTVFASASLVFVERRRPAFNVRESYARWLEWLNGGVDLSRALAGVVARHARSPLFRGIVDLGGVRGCRVVCVARRLEARLVRADRAAASLTAGAAFCSRPSPRRRGVGHLGGRGCRAAAHQRRPSSPRCGGSPRSAGCCLCGRHLAPRCDRDGRPRRLPADRAGVLPRRPAAPDATTGRSSRSRPSRRESIASIFSCAATERLDHDRDRPRPVRDAHRAA